MKKSILFLMILSLILIPLASAVPTTYDNAKLSRLFTIKVNSDGSINLSRMVAGNQVYFGTVEGAITVKGTTALVKNGKFTKWNKNDYVLAKGNFKLDSKNGLIIVTKSTSNVRNYGESNDYRFYCEIKDCEINLKTNKTGMYILIPKGVAKLTPAIKDVDKHVLTVRKAMVRAKKTDRKSKTNNMLAFSINISQAMIRMPYNINRDKFYFHNMKRFKLMKFGWKILPLKEVEVEFRHRDNSYFVPIALDFNNKGFFYVFYSPFESTLKTNYVSVTSKGVIYSYSPNLPLAGFVDPTLSILDSMKTYEDCRSTLTFWTDKTCVYYDKASKTIRLHDRKTAKTQAIIYSSPQIKKVIINPMNNKSTYDIVNTPLGGNKVLKARRSAITFQNTRDWKDIGVSFSIFVYNKKTNNFDRVECDLPTRKCKLNGKDIYDPVKKFRCRTNNDCRGTSISGLKCVNNRCVVPKKCEPLKNNRGAKLNILFVANGYDTRQEALGDAKRVALSTAGSGPLAGPFEHEPLKSYKDKFGFYFLEEALAVEWDYVNRKWSNEYDITLAEKSCAGSKFVIVLDKLATPCYQYCPFRKLNKVQLPSRTLNIKDQLPSFAAHEFGHLIGLLDDEYRSWKAASSYSYRLHPAFGGRRIPSLNCMKGHRALTVWPRNVYIAAGNRAQKKTYKGCGGNCYECLTWYRASDNSIMNNRGSKPNGFVFNKASKEQYEFFIRRWLNMPYNNQDNKVWRCLRASMGQVFNIPQNQRCG